MKTPLQLTLLYFFFFQVSHAQSTKDNTSKEKVIAVFERFFVAVKDRDQDMLNALLDDEFLLTSSDSNGEFLNKEQYVSGAANPDLLKVVDYKLYDYNLSIYGNTAILRCRIDWKSTFRGKPWNANFLNTDILVYKDKEWRIVSRHSSYPANQLKRIVEERY